MGNYQRNVVTMRVRYKAWAAQSVMWSVIYCNEATAQKPSSKIWVAVLSVDPLGISAEAVAEVWIILGVLQLTQRRFKYFIERN